MPRPKRRLGQHFLSDPRLLARIADALAPTAGDTVLEVGAGPGGLTAELAARAGRVIALEKDPELVPILRQRLPRVTVIEGDALELDWHQLVSFGSACSWLVAGNIPYNITSPLIDKALEPPRPARIVYLVQKEVADRVTAAPGSAAYGALTVGVQAVAVAQRVMTVPAGAFHPRPQVDSAVLRLLPVSHPIIADEEREGFRRLVVGLFGFRRKQLIRGVRELTGWDADRAAAVLESCGIEPAARPEVLQPALFARLYHALVDGGWGNP